MYETRNDCRKIVKRKKSLWTLLQVNITDYYVFLYSRNVTCFHKNRNIGGDKPCEQKNFIKHFVPVTSLTKSNRLLTCCGDKILSRRQNVSLYLMIRCIIIMTVTGAMRDKVYLPVNDPPIYYIYISNCFLSLNRKIEHAWLNYLLIQTKLVLVKSKQSVAIIFAFIEQPSTSSDIVETAEEDVDVLQSPTNLSYDTIEVIDGNSFCICL